MLNLDDRIILTPKGILSGCPRCGGQLYWDGEDTKCWCGYVRYDKILNRDIADQEILTESADGTRKRGVPKMFTKAELGQRYRERKKLGLVGVRGWNLNARLSL